MSDSSATASKQQLATPHTVSLTHAAKLAGISRSTLHRDVKKGRISKGINDRGSPTIAISELERVYGKLHRPDSSATVPKPQLATSNEDKALQVELRFLREQTADLKAERDRLLGLLEEQAKHLRLLTDQRTPPQRPFWKWLGGRA